MSQEFIRTKLSAPFITESGFHFEEPEVAFKVWGTLNPERDNAIVICHALTGDSSADEWFSGLIGPNAVCDPDQHFIICVNVPGSCYGSIGPESINPDTGRPYRGSFPEITIRDMVRFQQQVLDELEIHGIELVIGGSMGGMQALEFAVMDSRVRSAVPIATGKAHTPWAIGISHAQRRAIQSDPNWNGGFYNSANPPTQGLANARRMAMLTYRSPVNYQSKFGRNLQPDSQQFQVESYLDYQGQKLVNRFDANSYVVLSKAMDSHDLSFGRGTFEDALKRVHAPVLVIGINSDLLYPTQEQKELAGLLPNGEYAEIDSEYGHDAFLIEFNKLNKTIQPFTSKLKKAEAV